MSWEIFSVSDWAQWSAAWAQLAQACCSNHPLLDPLFIGPLLDNFGGPDTYLAVQTEQGAAIRMILLERRGWGNWESFTPSQMPLATVVAADHARLAPAIRTLWPKLPGIGWLIGLQRWDEHYQGSLRELGPEFETVPYATTISVAIEGPFSSFWHARPSKLRSNIGRYLRRIEKTGLGWRFSEVSATAEVDAAILEYGRLESRGWKGAEGSAISEDNLQGRFYRAVMRNFSGRAQARVFELRVGEHLVASRLGIDNGAMVVFLKTAYDEERSDLAPGRVLLYLVLERLFNEGRLRRAEFYTNASPDQLQWCTDSRGIGHLNCHRAVWLRRAHEAWHRPRRQRAAKAAESNEPADHPSA